MLCARDHRGVAEAIRSSWADAGVCLRLTSEEANLSFLCVRREAYDICFPEAVAGDPGCGRFSRRCVRPHIAARSPSSPDITRREPVSSLGRGHAELIPTRYDGRQAIDFPPPQPHDIVLFFPFHPHV